MSEVPGEPKKYGVRVKKGPVSGTARLQVSYLRKGDPGFKRLMPSGDEVIMGIPLEKLRERLGGNEGYVIGPTGEQHHVAIPPDLPDGEGIIVSLKYRITPDEPKEAPVHGDLGPELQG